MKRRNETNFYGSFCRPCTVVYTSESRRSPISLKAVDPDIRNSMLFAIGVVSGADLAERVVEARSKIDDFRYLLIGRMLGFGFEDAVNLQDLTK